MRSPSPPPTTQAGFANTCLRHLLSSISLSRMFPLPLLGQLPEALLCAISQLTSHPIPHCHLLGIRKTKQGGSSSPGTLFRWCDIINECTKSITVDFRESHEIPLIFSSADSKMQGPKGATQDIILTLCPSWKGPGRQTFYPQRKDSVGSSLNACCLEQVFEWLCSCL